MIKQFKQLIITITICACTFVTLAAQTTGLTLGPKAGLNFANWSTNFTNIEGRVAFHLGGFAQYSINEQFGAQVELLFNSIGAKSTSNTNPSRIVTNYLSIPILANFKPIEALSIHAGIQPSFLLTANTVVTSGANEGTHDNKDLFKGTDFAFLIGAEYAINETITAGLRINLGLNDIAEDNEDETKSRVVQIYASFPLVRP